MEKQKKKLNKTFLAVLFLLVLIGVTVFVLFKSSDELDADAIFDFLENCNGWFLLCACACMFGSVTFEALSLRSILRTFGYRPKLSSAYAYSTADVYYSALTPSASGGQPASAAFMLRDKIGGGETSFTLVFNTIAYTASIIIVGGVIFVLDFSTFLTFDTFIKVLILIGVVCQIALLSFFIACLRWKTAVLKLGNALISFLSKIHLSKNPDKLREKFSAGVEKYCSGGQKIRQNKWLFFRVFLFNVLQRVCKILVTCFVIEASGVESGSFYVNFCLQTFVTVGYCSIPLPGGVGAFDYIYMNIYGMNMSENYVLIIMMITRVISYYACFILSGIYTGIYHLITNKRKIETVRVETQTEENTIEG